MAEERLVTRRYGDTVIAHGNDSGHWIYASGTAFPFDLVPAPHTGATFFRTDLKALYVFSAGTWSITGNAVFSGLSLLTVGPTEPVSPSEGDLWVDTT